MADASEKPRWYRLTPGRLLPVILAVEGVLWLSERFCWMSKGWPVVIAIGAVGVFVVLMFLWFLAALVFRWRFQFSIRSLLVLTLVVAVACSWLAVEREQARKQRVAVEAIEVIGGTVAYDYELDPNGRPIPNATPPGPTWLHELLGDNLFVDVAQVNAGTEGFFNEQDAEVRCARSPTPCWNISRVSPNSVGWNSAAPR